jgi:hypothetical protein
LVAFAGPPAVVTATVSNTWNDPITVMISTTASTGRSSGMVIRQNIRHSLAPSTRAASYMSLGMACRPANSSRAV